MSIKKECTADFESAVHRQFLVFHLSLRIKSRLLFFMFWSSTAGCNSDWVMDNIIAEQ